MSAFTPSLPVLHHIRNTSQSTPTMASSRPSRRNNRRQPPKRQPQLPQSAPDVFQFFDEQDQPVVEGEDLSDIDDGFFSRYMREREQEKEKEPEDEPLRRGMDRDTAASAFDAVDKLFGSVNADKKGEERRKWLSDVQARAATSEDTRKGDALDVDAEDVNKDEFAEAEIEDEDKKDKETVKRRLKQQPPQQQPRNAKADDKFAFDTLIKIARRGPTTDSKRRVSQPPRREPREKREVRDTGRDTQRDRDNPRDRDNLRDRDNPRDRDNLRDRDQSFGQSNQKRNPDFSHLLGLTKRIIDRNDESYPEDDYEAIDDEMEKTINFVGSVKRKDPRRRQKYTAVRRIGGQSRRIHAPPVDWLPMTEEDIDNLKSDHRSLGGARGDNGKLKGVVADCRECRGSGLDTCIACLGAGWVPQLKDGEKMNEERRAILADMWNEPNLVVDNDGEAQCLRCNGIGKQFCGTCKGSGSALRKGFGFWERDEVFDMFVNVDGAQVGEEDDEYTDDDDEDDEDDFDSFQLYQGSPEKFNFMRKKRDDNGSLGEDDDDDNDGDDVDVDDVIEVEDESAELLAALEAMHLADAEEEKTGKKTPRRRSSRVSTIDDDDDDNDVDVDVDVGDDDDDVDVDVDVDDVDDDIVDEIDDVDDIENVSDGEEVVNEEDDEDDEDEDDDDDDDDFPAAMSLTNPDDLKDLDEEDDFSDLEEERISDMTLAGEDQDEDEDEDESEEDVNDDVEGYYNDFE